MSGLLFQEVDRRCSRSFFSDQAGLVAPRLGYEHVYSPVLRRNVIGGCGNALLTRSAIRG